MAQTIAKTAGIILLVSPSDQVGTAIDALKNANLDYMRADAAGPCLAIVQKIQPNAILMDLDLALDECVRIIVELGKTVEGRNIPIVLMAQAAQANIVKERLLWAVQDILFKPIRAEELIARLELAQAKSYKGSPCGLDEAGRALVVSARKACHELNQPLQFITGSIQLALLDSTPDDPDFILWKGLLQQSERMIQITANLVELIRAIG